VSGPIQFLVGFSGTSDFSGPYDDVSEYVDDGFGFTCSRGKEQILELSPPAPGQASFALQNQSRLFSAENTASPLYPITPPMDACIKMAAGEGDGFLFEDGDEFLFEDGAGFLFEGTPGRIIWAGIVREIEQHPEGENRTVVFRCLGTLSRLIEKMISTPVYEDILVSDAIDIVLNKSDWPADKRNIQTSATVLDYWSLDNEDAFEALKRLLATEGPGASIYEDPTGALVFENALSRDTQTRSTVSQFTLSDTALPLQGLTYDPNYKSVIGAATVTVQEKAPGAKDVIWRLDGGLVLAPNEVRRFRVRPNGGEAFVGATAPSPVGVNAQQRIVADQVLTSGNVKLGYKGALTADIAWNASASTVEGELEALSTIGPSNVRVTGMSFSDGFLVTFINALGDQQVELLTVQSGLNPTSARSTIDVAGVDPVVEATQTLTPHSTPLNAGTFKLQWDSHVTAAINYNDPASTIQVKIRAIGPGVFPSTTITTSGGPINTTPVTVNIDEGQLIGGLFPFIVIEDETLMASGQASATLVIT
jgi:hypothetical protein